jgi:probable HAF family extracellular repeat protein
MNRTILTAVGICVWCAGAYATPQYTVTGLGGLPGYTYETYATGLNNSGQVVGYCVNYTGTATYHAFLYSGGQMQDLGTFGGADSAATGINDAGVVVGSANAANKTSIEPFVYSGGQMQRVGSLGGGDGRCLWHQ